MVRRLFELVGSDPEIGFSPFAWRTRLALAHKGIEYERQPWRFTDKEAIAPTGQGRVPVLQDGEIWTHDSWAIACYLDDSYPDTPPLMGKGARANIMFINSWADHELLSAIRPIVALRVAQILDGDDLTYFRDSREKALGKTLEDVSGPDPLAHRAGLKKTLKPVAYVLRNQEFVGGDSPDYSDHIIMGSLMWMRALGLGYVLEDENPLEGWYLKMLALYQGEAGSAKCYSR